QPDPTGESSMTTASRSLATALAKARVASGLLPLSYTITGGTTKKGFRCRISAHKRCDAPKSFEVSPGLVNNLFPGVRFWKH
ncbi:hypothetical protein, partial [Methylocystis sp.]|uniref:hypothetical protein n=1 Tax=Methylocystis sp. TaxID=1911079 RepID=UPI0025D5AFFB